MATEPSGLSSIVSKIFDVYNDNYIHTCKISKLHIPVLLWGVSDWWIPLIEQVMLKVLQFHMTSSWAMATFQVGVAWLPPYVDVWRYVGHSATGRQWRHRQQIPKKLGRSAEKGGQVKVRARKPHQTKVKNHPIKRVISGVHVWGYYNVYLNNIARLCK